jgi:low affinity Fe/Cu permease
VNPNLAGEVKPLGGFSRFAGAVARGAGRSSTFTIALLVVVAWAVTGPMFHYSDTWQLCINTGTTIVTFLMVFLIQNTQNRDGVAIQMKLDELIRATKGARDTLLDLEECGEGEMHQLRQRYLELAKHAREHAKSR